MLMAALTAIAVILTATMFATRNSMLGFPSAMFWALLGGYAYTLSTTTWDIYFLFAFASLLGMVTFTALGAYGLREKQDSIGEQSMEGKLEDDDGFFDEKPEPDLRGDVEMPEQTRSEKIRARAAKRRKKLKW